eukprot:305614_1
MWRTRQKVQTSGDQIIQQERDNEQKKKKQKESLQSTKKTRKKRQIDKRKKKKENLPKKSYDDEKQPERVVFTYIDMEFNRNHEPTLALLVRLKSNKKQYDDLNRFESLMLTDLMTKVYDVYQPNMAMINCGHKSQDYNPTIHWVFDFSVDRFKTIFKQISSNTCGKDKEILKSTQHHFNQKNHLFTHWRKYANLLYIKKDSGLFTLNWDDIKLDCLKFGPIKCDLNPSFSHQSCSFCICIQTKKKSSISAYSKPINHALQQLIQFTHSSRDFVIHYLESIDFCLLDRHHQALTWFELNVSRRNQQISVRCIVTVFHFMFILFRNAKLDPIDIGNWFDKYCSFVAKELRLLSKYKRVTCDYNAHHKLHWHLDKIQLTKTTYLGKGVKNQHLDAEKITNDGINRQKRITKMSTNSSENERYNCKQCDVTCTSKQWESHISGRKHKRLTTKTEQHSAHKPDINALKQSINNIIKKIGNDTKWRELRLNLKEYELSLKINTTVTKNKAKVNVTAKKRNS